MQVACNYRKAAKTHSQDIIYPCPCTDYPDHLKDQRGCVNCRLHELAAIDPALMPLSRYAKDVFHHHPVSIQEELVTQFKLFVDSFLLPFSQHQYTYTMEKFLKNLPDNAHVFLKPSKLPHNGVNSLDVMNAIRKLRPFIISILDKNNGRFHVQCPRTWHADFQKTFIDNPNYTILESSTKDILAEQKLLFRETGLHKIAPWATTGNLPYAYILKKHKDLNKTRPIVACFQRPDRVTMGVAAKGASLAIKLVVNMYHMDITAVHHMVEELMHANTKFEHQIQNQDELCIATYDVNQMFDRLSHVGVLEDAKYFFSMLATCCTEDIFRVPRGKNAQAAIGKNPGKGNGYQATFSNVYTALEYELGNTTFTAGILVIQQLMGAGMGGRMSPFAARVTCMVQEHKWQIAIKEFLSAPIVMTRLVDDTQAVFSAEDAPLLTWYQHGCYRPEILVERETGPGKQALALGCKIWIEDGVGIQVTSANKNEESILKHGQITFTRFPSWDSPLRSSIKVGTVKGEVARMIRCTTPTSYQHLEHEFGLLTMELSLRGYPWRWIKRTFHHIKLSGMPIDGAYVRSFHNMWKNVLYNIRKMLL